MKGAPVHVGLTEARLRTVEAVSEVIKSAPVIHRAIGLPTHAPPPVGNGITKIDYDTALVMQRQSSACP